jgi:hypothetical protein
MLKFFGAIMIACSMLAVIPACSKPTSTDTANTTVNYTVTDNGSTIKENCGGPKAPCKDNERPQ